MSIDPVSGGPRFPIAPSASTSTTSQGGSTTRKGGTATSFIDVLRGATAPVSSAESRQRARAEEPALQRRDRDEFIPSPDAIAAAAGAGVLARLLFRARGSEPSDSSREIVVGDTAAGAGTQSGGQGSREQHDQHDRKKITKPSKPSS